MSLLPILLNFVAVLLLCFVSFNFLLQKFIYEKIKLIYRSIYQFKVDETGKKNALDKSVRNPLDKVSKEVIDWMAESRKELDQLKAQENFRREFLGNVSHELKTPIQNIQGYIHTLLDGALNDKKVNELFLTKAANSSDRLVELVDDLTSISAMEDGKVLDLSPLIWCS